MSKRKLAYLVGSTCIAVAAAVGALVRHGIGRSAASAANPPATQPLVQWDLSGARRSAAVYWPVWNTSDLFIIDGPQPVEIRLPGGKVMRSTFDAAHVRRKGDIIRLVWLMPRPEALDAAYQRAARLLSEWSPESQASLRKWYTEQRQHAPSSIDRDASTFNSDPQRRYGVEVGWTGYRDLWLVTWWASLDKPDPTTAPADPGDSHDGSCDSLGQPMTLESHQGEHNG